MSKIEGYIEQHKPIHLKLLRSISGIGRILALTIIYEIGNAHLKWAFSEAAALFLHGNKEAQDYLLKLQKRMSKAKALSVLAHKMGRCVYFMLVNETMFDEKRFLKA